jgi:hypothetical protein
MAREGKPSAGSYSSKPTVHTLLRLPTGIFYAKGGPSRTGMKANVLFFARKPAAEKP